MGTQGEIFRGVISYSHPAGSICQNVFTWELQDEDTADATVLDAIEVWADDEWAPPWKLLADSNSLMYLLEVDVLNTNGTVKRNVGEAIIANVGNVVGDVLPAAVSGFFQADTERAKSFGRKYVPAISDLVLVEGEFTGPFLADLILLLIATTTNIDVGVIGVLQAGVLSRITQAFLDFTGSGYATDVPAYQRRRKKSVGS